MAAPRKYPEELRERAIRMAVDLRRDPATRTGALRRVGDLGSTPRRCATGSSRLRSTRATDLASPALRHSASPSSNGRTEDRELRRANEILKTASAFFAAAELDRKLK